MEIHPDRTSDYRWFERPAEVAPQLCWWVAVLRNNRLAPE
jgi:hypothetical protein